MLFEKFSKIDRTVIINWNYLKKIGGIFSGGYIFSLRGSKLKGFFLILLF